MESEVTDKIQEELEARVKSFEEQGWEYLPIMSGFREEGMVLSPSGERFSRSRIERWAKRTKRLKFGDRPTR